MTTVIFSHGQESGPWGTKIRAMAELVRGMGCEADSIDYQRIADPTERVHKCISTCAGIDDQLVLVGSSMGGHVATAAAAETGAAGLFVLAGFILFAAAKSANNFKRVLRHPQLTGVLSWAIGHLLANGDSRSLVLFGTLAAWSVIEMIAINRRDGAWQKPERAPLRVDVITVVIGVVLFVVFLLLHRWIAGIPLVSFGIG